MDDLHCRFNLVCRSLVEPGLYLLMTGRKGDESDSPRCCGWERWSWPIITQWALIAILDSPSTSNSWVSRSSHDSWSRSRQDECMFMQPACHDPLSLLSTGIWSVAGCWLQMAQSATRTKTLTRHREMRRFVVKWLLKIQKGKPHKLVWCSQGTANDQFDTLNTLSIVTTYYMLIKSWARFTASIAHCSLDLLTVFFICQRPWQCNYIDFVTSMLSTENALQ